jgi:hypothetical protein
VTGIAFSPDGKTLAVSLDNIIILDGWSWLDLACQLAGRNLSQAEWKEYLGDIPYQKTCPQYPAGE